MTADPTLSADGKTVLFRHATAWERQFQCEGLVYVHRPNDNRQCTHKAAWVDPRDDALYCTMHRDAVQERGVDGVAVKVTP